MGSARLLVVAGHDKSGAGIDADRAALLRESVEASFVVTAYTEQDERGVRSIGARAAREWLTEARRELARGPCAIKFGLLPGHEHILAARELVERARRGSTSSLPVSNVHVVVDPVIAASSGGRFLTEADVETLRGELCGAGVVLTPNLPETAQLARVPLSRLEHNLHARSEAARILLALGLSGLVIKGGHGTESPAHDLVFEENGRTTLLEHARIPNAKIRGSGCRFATHLAARLAQGDTLPEAARIAAEHVRQALLGA